MPRGVASSKQMAMMQRALDAYCTTYQITDPATRENLAAMIFDMFDSGLRDEETLLAELIRRRP